MAWLATRGDGTTRKTEGIQRIVVGVARKTRFPTFQSPKYGEVGVIHAILFGFFFFSPREKVFNEQRQRHADHAASMMSKRLNCYLMTSYLHLPTYPTLLTGNLGNLFLLGGFFLFF